MNATANIGAKHLSIFMSTCGAHPHYFSAHPPRVRVHPHKNTAAPLAPKTPCGCCGCGGFSCGCGCPPHPQVPLQGTATSLSGDRHKPHCRRKRYGAGIGPLGTALGRITTTRQRAVARPSSTLRTTRFDGTRGRSFTWGITTRRLPAWRRLVAQATGEQRCHDSGGRSGEARTTTGGAPRVAPWQRSALGQ